MNEIAHAVIIVCLSLLELKMAVSRFQIASNKKTALIKQQMREIAVMLADDPPREEKAKIRSEALIREDHAVEAYEILQLECELLAERIKLIQVSKECPPDLVSIISTLIWACDRVDIQELSLIRKQFRAKYGKQFEEDALNNVGGVLNERVVSKLSVQPPAAYLVQTYLERICEKFEVDWTPKVPLTAENMAQPMAAPVGYSVQVAGGTGLGEVVTTGQANIDDKVGYMGPPPPPKDDDFGGSSFGGSGGGTPVATATRYVPMPAPFEAKDDFQEVDIFVPAIPTAPVGRPKNGGDDESGKEGASYNDLAARFDELNK
jgi:vacuolar protein sorting-associated protein IST1